jgi:manganese/zinc/iron transport system substrate-binding protein
MHRSFHSFPLRELLHGAPMTGHLDRARTPRPRVPSLSLRVDRKGRVAAILLLAGLLFVAAGCASEGVERSDGRLQVVTTVGMITDITRTVGGDRVSVTGLMGPGIDPHLYKASAGDVRRLGSADLILYNGLHLEAAMGDVLRRMDGRTRTRAVTDAIPRERLLTPPEWEGQYDPHVWSDVSLWMYAVEAVADALAEADPEGEPLFRENAAVLREELEELDTWVREQVARVPGEMRVLVTAHDAFNYFGTAYGFRVEGLQGLSTVTEAGTGDVQRVARLVAEKRIPAIFIESSIPRRNVEAVQAAVRSRGFEVEVGGMLFSDAMGDPGTEEGTYPGMVRHNVSTIVEALAGDPPVVAEEAREEP